MLDSEAKYAGIIASAMDAIIAVNSRQQITVFNAAAEKIVLCAAQQAIGKPLSILIPTRFHEALSAHFQIGTTNRAWVI